MPQEIMDELKIEANDEVTIQTVREKSKYLKNFLINYSWTMRMPKRMWPNKSKSKLINAMAVQNVQMKIQGNLLLLIYEIFFTIIYSINSKTLFFHANDIVNSFRKAYSGKIVNLNVTGKIYPLVLLKID